MVERGMLERVIGSEFDGWPLLISSSPNKRTLYNFPMQSGGAEMLRLAANRLCDADLVPIMLVHDGILFELDTEEQVQHAIEIMRNAGTEVCGGLEIGVDVDQKLIGGGGGKISVSGISPHERTLMDGFRAASCCACTACCPPSSSMITRADSQQKSTTYDPIGILRRNFGSTRCMIGSTGPTC